MLSNKAFWLSDFRESFLMIFEENKYTNLKKLE